MPLIISNDHKKFKKNDLLFLLNDHLINDIIDLRFYLQDENEIEALRKGEKIQIFASEDEVRQLCFYEDLPNIKQCINQCTFCFVEQLGPNMREKVYFKDDDWRLSFLSGNFITLTNLNEKEIDRIIEQRISPLYISIHSMDVKVRIKLGLLNPQKSIDDFKKLDSNGILTHVQLVLCPGVNDKEALENTLDELAKLKNIQTVGVVPVGITRFHSNKLSSITKEQSSRLIKFIDIKRDEYQEEKGCGWVYLADEFYLLAEIDIPQSSYYDDFEQLENGIGLTRQWLDSFDLNAFSKESMFVIVTAKLFSAVLIELFNDYSKVEVVSITNNFFGNKISVAGLLTAQDIIKQIKPREEPILIPDIVLNEDDLFLDDISYAQLRKELPTAVIVPSTGKEFQKWLENNF